MTAWGWCATCGQRADSCVEFLRHLDTHAGVKRPEDWYLPERHRNIPAQWDDATAVLVLRGPNGEIRYPGQHNCRVPDGYERVYLRSLQEVHRFEKEHHVMNHVMHYDNNGRALDDRML